MSITMDFVKKIKASKMGKRVFRSRHESFPKSNPKFKRQERGEPPLPHLLSRFRGIKGSGGTIASDQAAFSKQGEIAFLVKFTGGTEISGRGGTDNPVHRCAEADQKLLESFRMRKNAEWKEYWKCSEISNFPDGVEDKIREVFALTRRLLVKTVGAVNAGFIQNDLLLEKALGKVHKRLPLPIRLILWKKRYIQFILANRERLFP